MNLFQLSRAGSHTSLEAHHSNSDTCIQSRNHHSEINGEIAVIVGGHHEVSKQQIVERVVSLQRALAKKSEKVDFLSEHVRQLLDEVQKKNRVIQVLATKENGETGAFSSESMDKNKVAMSKRPGIMASVLSQEPLDGKMTLDLSLEISRKLQEVLEETLLKNMMLKVGILAKSIIFISSLKLI